MWCFPVNGTWTKELDKGGSSIQPQFVYVLLICPIKLSDKTCKEPHGWESIGAREIIVAEPFRAVLFVKKLAQKLSQRFEFFGQKFPALTCAANYFLQSGVPRSPSLARMFPPICAFVTEGILKLLKQVLYRASHTNLRQEQSPNSFHVSGFPRGLHRKSILGLDPIDPGGRTHVRST